MKVIIYTNNQGGKEWVSKIKNFMELKIGYDLFDRIIGPHKIKENYMKYFVHHKINVIKILSK